MLAARGLLLGAALLALAACTHPVRDSAPGTPPEGSPRPATVGSPGVPEPKSRQGNMPFYEVFGRRYYTLSTARGYRERGVASWYGTKFHGQSTSSGEPYDMYAMTAAHTTLPLPTWVEVRNLANDRRIVVRVNDRGPFVDNRLIDLSYAAAKEIDMIGDGTALVEVRALHSPDEISPYAIVATRYAPGAPIRRTPGADGPPPVASAVNAERATTVTLRTPDPEPPQPPPEPVAVLTPDIAADTPPASTGDREASAERLYVQVGAFASRDNAQALVSRLQADGFDDAFMRDEQVGDRMLHRVRIGPIASVDAYDAIIAELRSLDIHETRLISED